MASGTHLNILDEAVVAMGTTANLPGLVAVAIELNFRAFEAMVVRFVIDNGDLAAIAMEVTIDIDDLTALLMLATINIWDLLYLVAIMMGMQLT